MTPTLLFQVGRVPPADMEFAANLEYIALGLVIAFFVLRPEIWRYLFLRKTDPRPAGLLRIVLGTVLLFTFLGMLGDVRFLMTDDGLMTTEHARLHYGYPLRLLWDAGQGFQHWWDPLQAMWGRFTVLHLASPPWFVYAIYAVALVSMTSMILGYRTRIATIVAWISVEQLFRYSSVYYNGGDYVTQILFFLCLFLRWGEAYSIDSWLRRRRAVLGGARSIPALRPIPAWPQRLMVGQLTIIYCATGLLKSGPAWRDGSAMYYAMNLEHFYRVPMSGVVAVAQASGLLPLMTWTVHWWEMLFPLALIGIMLNGYHEARARGEWPSVPAWRRLASWIAAAVVIVLLARLGGLILRHTYSVRTIPFGMTFEQLEPAATAAISAAVLLPVALWLAISRWAPGLGGFIRRWLLGRRVWLLIGIGVHVGIELTMNVGTFSEAMVAAYLAWLTGPDIDAFWRFLSRRLPGLVIRYHPDAPSVRRAALLRIWDLAQRLTFVADDDVPAERLHVTTAAGKTIDGSDAGKALISVMPGLWWLWPLRRLPVVGGASGSLANMVLCQR